MAEPPERKVLKNLLVKLKAKSIASQNAFEKSYEDLGKTLMEFYNATKKFADQNPNDESAKDMKTLLVSITTLIGFHNKEATIAIEDLKLYVDALEDSYKELDETFEKAVYEPARRQAEAMIKEQEELSKKTKPEFYG